MFNIEKIKTLIVDDLASINYSLVSIKYQREGSDCYLHVVVDRKEPISMDDIEMVSHRISDKLDTVQEEFSDSYILDVCSMGAEKDLDVKDLKSYIGEYIEVHLINPIKGESYIVGTLVECSDELITMSFFVKGRKKALEIARNNIDRAKIVLKI
jgi:ribosome maturation factor RimP